MVDPRRLESFVVAICDALGADSEISAAVASHLVRANLSGHDSHGVARLHAYAELVKSGELKPDAHPQILDERAATALFDARSGFGQFSTRVALDWAIENATRSGAAVAAVRHSQHIGRLGEYGERAAAAGFIAIVTVGMAGDGVGAMVLPGTARRFFGANPWAYGIPLPSGDAVLVDVSTAVVAEGKIQVAASKGDSIPAGWAVDSLGNPTESPADYFAGGGLLPLGSPTVGHKGYGLGLASALLGGLATIGDAHPTMVGASVAADADPHGRMAGVLVVVIDPEAFGGRSAFAASVEQTVNAIHHASADVIVPGQPERDTRLQRDTALEIPSSTLAVLRSLAERLGVDATALA